MLMVVENEKEGAVITCAMKGCDNPVGKGEFQVRQTAPVTQLIFRRVKVCDDCASALHG